MEVAGKTCVVIGGAGFIGSHLVDVLLKSDCVVRVLDNLATGKGENFSHNTDNPNFTFVEGSILDEKLVAEVIEGSDFVYNLSCLGVRHSLIDPFENHRVNAEGSLIALEEARKQNIAKYIHCSSSEVYGTAQYAPMDEKHPTEPCTVYGASKLCGEAYARASFSTHGMPTVVIRPFNTFGPRSHYEGSAGEFIPKSIVRVLSGQNILIFGDGSNSRDFLYVEDTARGLLAAACEDSLVGRTLNIAAHFEISLQDLAKKIIAGCPSSDASIENVEERPGDVRRLAADSTRFIEMTGWKPSVSFDEGLAKTIEFFKNHPKGIDGLASEETGKNWIG